MGRCFVAESAPAYYQLCLRMAHGSLNAAPALPPRRQGVLSQRMAAGEARKQNAQLRAQARAERDQLRAQARAEQKAAQVGGGAAPRNLPRCPRRA